MVFRGIVHGAKWLAVAACAACDVGLPLAGPAADERPIPVQVEIVVAEPSIPALVLAGEVAAPGVPVVRPIEPSGVAVRAAVPRALLPLVRVGGAAEVRFGAAAARRLPGTIRRVDPAAATGGAVPFEVRVDDPGFVLRPGAVVQVGVAVPDREAGFSIPLASLRRGIDARPFAFVVVTGDGGDHIVRRRITSGGLRGDRASVIAGLAAGDRVVTFGQELVTVGDRVTIVGEGP